LKNRASSSRVVRPRARLQLRKVGLRDRLAAGLLGDRLHQLLLGHRPIQPAQRTLDLAQIANFFRQFHSPSSLYCDLQ
jgi:hypothetical protein